MRSSRRLAIQLIIIPLLVGCSTLPINELPMYGGKEKSAEIQEVDQVFIDWAVEEFGSRAKASEDAANRGWRSFYQNDQATAMRRFNQAWLLDTNNAHAYWGFGNILGQQAYHGNTEQRLRESITFLETANRMQPKNARIMTDLAHSHTMLAAAVLKRQHRPGADDEFAQAQALLEEAEMIEPSHPLLHYNWSVLDFYRGDYAGAKRRLDKAVILGFTAAPDYVKDLNRKLKR